MNIWVTLVFNLFLISALNSQHELNDPNFHCLTNAVSGLGTSLWSFHFKQSTSIILNLKAYSTRYYKPWSLVENFQLWSIGEQVYEGLRYSLYEKQLYLWNRLEKELTNVCFKYLVTDLITPLKFQGLLLFLFPLLRTKMAIKQNLFKATK